YVVGASLRSSITLTSSTADDEIGRAELSVPLEEHPDRTLARQVAEQPRGLFRRFDRDPVDLDDQVALPQTDLPRDVGQRDDQRASLADQAALGPDRRRKGDELEIGEGPDALRRDGREVRRYDLDGPRSAI